MKMSPFDFINSISSTKKYLMEGPDEEKVYNKFIVNRGLSYFHDTIFYAQNMNYFHELDSKLQYDNLINTIRPAKRFSKWVKTSKQEDIELVMEYYGYSSVKAKEVLPLLNNEQLKIIRTKLEKGGVQRK